MFYSSRPAELRAFLQDKLGWKAADVGDGWLILDLPEADMGVHPSVAPDSAPSGTKDISFYCDDIEATMSELSTKGVEFTGPVENRGYGLVTFMKVPRDFEIMLYQPLYQK